MSIWVLRGLRDGVVTTRWPGRADEYADSWRGPVIVRADAGDVAVVPAGLCPAGAIQAGRPGAGGPGQVHPVRAVRGGAAGRVRLVRGRHRTAAAALTREALVVPELPETGEAVAAARARLRERTAALRRSVHIRHVDAGSDGSEEWEIQALLGPVYDIHRLGLFFTASPRHADVLLVTGAGTAGMAGPLRTTYEGMPDPRVVIAVGTDGGRRGRSRARRCQWTSGCRARRRARSASSMPC